MVSLKRFGKCECEWMYGVVFEYVRNVSENENRRTGALPANGCNAWIIMKITLTEYANGYWAETLCKLVQQHQRTTIIIIKTTYMNQKPICPLFGRSLRRFLMASLKVCQTIWRKFSRNILFFCLSPLPAAHLFQYACVDEYVRWRS